MPEKELKVLSEIRTKYQRSVPEAGLLSTDEAVADFTEKLQVLYLKKNSEIATAISEIDKRYAQQIAELESEYAFYLVMVSENLDV
jgi:hypothetical protein